MSSIQGRYIIQLQKRLIESQKKCILLFQELNASNNPADEEFKSVLDEVAEIKELKEEIRIITQENKMLSEINERQREEIKKLHVIIKSNMERSRSPARGDRRSGNADRRECRSGNGGGQREALKEQKINNL